MALIVLLLLGIAVLAGVALLLAFNEDGVPDETVDHGDLGLPTRLLSAEDIPRLRFRVGMRGYRMEDVDAALERIQDSMRHSEPPPTA